MNRHISHIFLLLFILLWVGCAQDRREARDGELIVSGTFQNGSDTVLLFEELTPSDLIPVDSIYTDAEGNFSFSLFIEDAGFYRLFAGGANFITLAAEPGENIEIFADFSNMAGTYTVEGSQGSKIIWEINREKLKGVKKADSLRMLYNESRLEPNFVAIREELKQAYRDIKKQQRSFVIRIIEDNPNSLASILALYQYFEDHMLLRENDHFEYFEMLSKTLCDIYPTNKHVIDLKKRVADHKREERQRMLNEQNLAAGKPAPEIVLPDPEGNQVALSSLQGNLVLVDFWAAWCPPCRKANRTLGKLYEKYKDRGFEIYGVSLDRTREQWLNAIEADNITWHQVSDLRFMNSPVVNLYNISEIPHTVLVDREGNIIARNFPVEELESLLLEHL
ncbi:MAG: AhpC/TSA family protein [Bacteroidetes bacterium]|nr:MAG: AhpC/TSA family protein [Bacteroidota bacterium]